MHATTSQHDHTYAEYLLLEEESNTRHEYFDGEIYAMAGGTPDHAALAATVLAIIRAQLPRGGRTYTSDLRLRVSARVSTYPDGTVICGGSERATDDPIAVINPSILIEVTSNSTEKFDRTDKVAYYQTIPTLREIVIVSHREPRLTLHRREEQQWTVEEAVSGQSIKLESIGGKLIVDDVYRDGLEDAAPQS